MESPEDSTEHILPEANEQVLPQKKFNVFFIRHGKPVVASENYWTTFSFLVMQLHVR